MLPRTHHPLAVECVHAGLTSSNYVCVLLTLGEHVESSAVGDCGACCLWPEDTQMQSTVAEGALMSLVHQRADDSRLLWSARTTS